MAKQSLIEEPGILRCRLLQQAAAFENSDRKTRIQANLNHSTDVQSRLETRLDFDESVACDANALE